jgi:hypothetical protein
MMNTNENKALSIRNQLCLNFPKTDAKEENYVQSAKQINENIAVRKIGSSKVCEHQRKLEQLLLTAK